MEHQSRDSSGTGLPGTGRNSVLHTSTTGRWKTVLRIARHLLACVTVGISIASNAASAMPDTVKFSSLDASTTLTAYLFKPSAPGPWPAVVMMHGRSGPYSSAAKGKYTAATLSQRHKMWGEFWAARGYAALLVDSFGPRGHPGGFAAGTYKERPTDVNEQRVRPLDAYGALAWLRTRGDVIPDRIGLQGWSNGAMATLAIVATRPLEFKTPFNTATMANAFRAALAFYPGCNAQRNTDWKPYAPLVMMVASKDEEVSPVTCRRLAEEVKKRGADAGFEFIWYEGAQHAFDDPGKARQAVPANRTATEDAMKRAGAFFARELK